MSDDRDLPATDAIRPEPSDGHPSILARIRAAEERGRLAGLGEAAALCERYAARLSGDGGHGRAALLVAAMDLHTRARGAS